VLALLARNWWLIAIRGIAAIIFGFAALYWPEPTFVLLVALFGAYALIDGLSLLASLVRGDPQARRHAWAVGAILLPVWTAVTIVYLVGFWSVAMGALQVAGAIALRREIEGELWMALGGVVAILFGAYIVVFPAAGILTLVWLVALWAIVFGIANLRLALRLRALANRGPMARPA
jgi:uncharacterized membrane protein HdeD (DUF308 family)